MTGRERLANLSLMAGRKIENEDDARACLSAALESGLSSGDWGRANGVDGRSLHAWRLKLDPPARSPTARTRMVGLVTRGDERGLYVVRVGRFGVEFGADFEEGTLRRVLAVVSSC